MTGLLRDTMNEHADAAGYPQLDLDAIIANGERRVRRRRIAVTGAAAAVAAAVIAAVAIGPSAFDLRSDRTPPITQQPGPFAAARPTYAVGSTIHYGADVLDSTYAVRSLAQTDDGFVYSAPEGQVMFTDGETDTQIGVTDSAGSQLADDVAGPYVGWVDPSGAGAPDFVVYDTRTGAEAVRTSEGSLPGAAQNHIDTMSAMIAIDGGVAYWHDGTGVKAYDIASGTLTSVKDGAGASWLDDVAGGGVLAHQADLRYRGDAGAQTIVVSPDPDATQPGFNPSSHGYLAPDAAHVAVFGGDETQIIEVATGRDVTPAATGYAQVAFGTWIDDDRFTFVAYRGRGTVTVDLLTCSVSAGSCDVAAHDVSGTGQDPVISPGMPAS
jgi:hypothetical protein